MDVINLVSSDEEDNDDGVRSKIKANKNIVFKKVTTPKVLQNVKEVSTQKVTPTMVHPKNNNTKQVVVLQAFKPQNQQSRGPQPTLLRQSQQTPLLSKSQSGVLTNPQPLQFPKKQHTQLIVSKVKFKDGKPVENKKPMLNPASGITITAVSSKSAVIPNNHGNSTVSNVGSVTTKPRTDKVKIVSKPNVPTVIQIQPAKSINAAISNHGLLKPGKRVVPTKISDTVTMRASSIEKSSDSDMLSRDSSSVANDEIVSNMDANGTNKPEQNYEPKAKRQKIIETVKEPMHQDYIHLIEVCKKADPTEDMKKIGAKLEKYYYKAHTMFVNSKSFRKLVESVTAEIQAQPKLVYKKINNLLEELKSRKATENETVPTEENTGERSEADSKKAKLIQKLSNALREMHSRIRQSEEAEVDWDEENNSKYLQTERFKKRAWEIYEKLCDLTGESRTAERIVKKPIRFNGTEYKEFNRKLERFINDTKSFPDMFDVLRIMDHCCEKYNYRMSKEHRKTVAQGAFHDVGTLLQKRRKSDLYEMVEYFAANHDDPAGGDPSLKMKLEENQRHYSRRMKEVIEKFTNHHHDSEVNDEEDSPVKIKPKTSAINVQVPPVSARLIEPELERSELNLSADIDMLNDSVTFISESGDYNDISKSDSILIDEQDVVHDLEREFLPTITSVTSLHPSEFNNLMNFEPISLTSSPMESAEIS